MTLYHSDVTENSMKTLTGLSREYVAFDQNDLECMPSTNFCLEHFLMRNWQFWTISGVNSSIERIRRGQFGLTELFLKF